jgi:hypothetical protein
MSPTFIFAKLLSMKRFPSISGASAFVLQIAPSSSISSTMTSISSPIFFG